MRMCKQNVLTLQRIFETSVKKNDAGHVQRKNKCEAITKQKNQLYKQCTMGEVLIETGPLAFSE